jgi:hypothetical protein
MSYVDAQIQDTTALSQQFSFGPITFGAKTVGRASGFSTDQRFETSAEGAQAITPTMAAKGSTAYGAESELAMGAPSSGSIISPGNWLTWAAVGVGVISIILALWRRK